ncbi:hypothetical protein BO94DRAFT_521628 [Aspergillus sclerotioniger CBS 115572]|uniref:F-box domain-containing protein n=1 Tax=Aspergillus sclerotioniger CBS 115572 TaxID=1450535 RepID=A0A317W2J1_9EURO|nr:hypothetical protein BO94DRAFT_521628 [Aspergillus sclerotioniger CBS 115572]PWY79398.1 hypothetical protein BO94DRAFT_521628 [Aspergillus sclerotioniger CBS 115572]
MANTADPPVNLTAMQRFLAVYKLVEDLLLNLDSRTLNFSKRVCRAWRDLIDGSDAIKEVYLMVPEPYLGQRQFRRPVRPVRRRNTLFNWPGRWLRAWLPRWFPRRHVRWVEALRSG